MIVNQPFGGGGLLRKLSGRKLPDWAAEIGCTSWAQILLKFVLANPAVTCVIPGTGKPEHMKDNVQAGLGVYPDAATAEAHGGGSRRLDRLKAPASLQAPSEVSAGSSRTTPTPWTA